MITLTQRERFRSTKTAGFKESVIRDMSRLALQHGAVNLAQGFPDFPAPELVKNAAVRAIERDVNQYANIGERNHFATQLRKNTERPTRWSTTLNERSRSAAARQKA